MMTISFCSSPKEPIWQMFHADINQDHMYSQNAEYMEDLLESLASLEITETEPFPKGTQLKFLMRLSDGNTVIVKTMRYL